MKIFFLCPQWGQEHLPLEEFFSNVKSAGYDGVETWMPVQEAERKKLMRLASEYKMQLVSHQHQAAGSSINEFCRSFEYYLHLSAACNPLHINSHSGKDYFSPDEQLQVIDTAANFSIKYNIAVLHETHRGRIFFSPGNAASIFAARPDVSITADFSHWVCVAENLQLTGFEAPLKKAINNAAGIHARVGFEEGPQIADPRLPVWEKEMTVFLGWWDDILQQAAAKGKEDFVITPEFGPAPYMWHIPPANQPVASQWEINKYMLQLLLKKYGATNNSVKDDSARVLVKSNVF